MIIINKIITIIIILFEHVSRKSFSVQFSRKAWTAVRQSDNMSLSIISRNLIIYEVNERSRFHSTCKRSFQR